MLGIGKAASRKKLPILTRCTRAAVAGDGECTKKHTNMHTHTQRAACPIQEQPNPLARIVRELQTARASVPLSPKKTLNFIALPLNVLLALSLCESCRLNSICRRGTKDHCQCFVSIRCGNKTLLHLQLIWSIWAFDSPTIGH